MTVQLAAGMNLREAYKRPDVGGSAVQQLERGSRKGIPRQCAAPNKGMEPTAYRCDVKVVRQEWS
jgi:hypothetical protein